MNLKTAIGKSQEDAGRGEITLQMQTACYLIHSLGDLLKWPKSLFSRRPLFSVLRELMFNRGF